MRAAANLPFRVPGETAAAGFSGIATGFGTSGSAELVCSDDLLRLGQCLFLPSAQ